MQDEQALGLPGRGALAMDQWAQVRWRPSGFIVASPSTSVRNSSMGRAYRAGFACGPARAP
jgi:hypothetical protein